METRLGGKYSGLFHHLLIVLFHSPRHRIRRETWPCKTREKEKNRVKEVLKRRKTIMYDTIRMQKGRIALKKKVCLCAKDMFQRI